MENEPRIMTYISKKNRQEKAGISFKWLYLVPVLSMAFLSFSNTGSFAQRTAAGMSGEQSIESPDLRDDLMMSVEAELQQLYMEDEVVDPPSIPSLFYTAQEHALLNEAREGFKARLPTLREMGKIGVANRLQYESEEEAQRLKEAQAAVREVSLAGILYVSKDEWIVWLNETRMTPDALPKEIMDIEVFNEYVELRWHDLKTKTIYPIRLRPNQRFNLDAKMFLPG